MCGACTAALNIRPAFHITYVVAAVVCMRLVDPSSQQVLDSLPLQEAPDAVVTSVRFRLPTAAGAAANRSMLLVAKVRHCSSHCTLCEVRCQSGFM
jgi:hypothetical protein